jgi:hypothetical protein
MKSKTNTARSAGRSAARNTSVARVEPIVNEAPHEICTAATETPLLDTSSVRFTSPDNDTTTDGPDVPTLIGVTSIPTEGPPGDTHDQAPDDALDGEIVPVSEVVTPEEERSVVFVSEAHDTEAPPRASAGLKGRSFLDVYTEVQRRADAMLPDRVVHVADLRMTPEGHVELPDGTRLRINTHAKRQVSSLLGLRWDRWFQSASGEERAEEVNRRFGRIPGQLKVRAWRDDTGEAHGVARAFLAATFTPIDDARIFERMNTMMRGILDEYRFTKVEFTDTKTHYTAVHAEPFDLDGDLLHPGWHLRNSEVGASALSLDDHWLRLVCANGLMVRVGGKRSLYRTHRAIEDDQLAAALVIAVGRLPERWRATFAWMQAAKHVAVPHPDDAVAAVLGDSSEVPRAMLEEAQREVLRVGDATRFGVVQAITLVAHAKNTDPDVRFAMERLAGDYLVAPQATAK